MDRLEKIPHLYIAILIFIITLIAYWKWPVEWTRDMCDTSFGAIMMSLIPGKKNGQTP